MSGITSDNVGRSSGLVKTGVSGITWQSVTTGSTLTAESGKGYPINTTSNACTVTLPSSPTVGDEIAILDYAGTADTNMITIDPGSLKLQGSTTDLFMDVERESVVLSYVDATQGWLVTRGGNEGETALSSPIFCDFLVLAGGGSGQEDNSGGGGAGGLRSSMTATGGGGSNESQIILTSGVAYTATVGAGYNASDGDSGSGVDSSLAGSGLTTITSAGGGEAGGHTGYGGLANGEAADGGCGGGGSSQHGGGDGGAGTANQGYAGGDAGGASNWPGGGGGTGQVGADGSTNQGGNGGNGTANSITGSSVTYGGGGGGGTWTGYDGTGGTGGGGAGSSTGGTKGADGGANLGGGAGGGGNSNNTDIADGGSGVVILRLLTSDYTGTSTGSPTVTTDGSYKVIKFTGTGTYTA